MTNKYSDRANGESYFTVGDLMIMKAAIDLMIRKSHDERDINMLKEIIISIDQESEYIRSMK